MVDLVIDSASKVCIMHMLGEPQSMQSNPEYTDVVAQVNGYLLDKARELVDKGHSIDDIYLDPGIGFGKNLEHNIELLNSSDSLRPYSVLWGVSRKSMIGQLTGKTDSAERLAGSLAIGALAHSSKIDIIRVHDVDEHMDLFKVLDAMEA
jgi:dihydropteroate synthase